ncbi:EAL and HDOD domain-containing protein [Candidatus Symbiopectobacterium sp. NZEC151]|uniref:EAL and HDOD domain-containing protein n=1 Tax=Candidatus Symbiopectobacterium sp. NZEC151 TaxID=2820470 RepID=UPI0022277C7C|nr:EAL domain-containing protein [Candidatus Symbiopectobacterium sp. NZEC151]MCW2477099.1 EAL domain-containing protein [Candidatus Symbiopectobacterium sp. NZEC151]
MYSFVARQPILNKNLQPVAYELLFRDGIRNAFPDVTPEYATAQIITEQFLTNSLSRLVDDHISYINVPHQMLTNGLVEALPPEKVVLEILENAPPDDTLLASVKRLKKRGFKLALDDFLMAPEWDRFLPYIDVLKFDLTLSSFADIGSYINKLPYRHITLLAEKVETREQFSQAKQLGISLFQGYFFSKPEIIQSRRLSVNNYNVLQLLSEVNKQELNYEQIEKLLSKDLSLAYKAMRYVNNIRLRSNLSLMPLQANFRYIAMLLGQKELRRFISLVTITSQSDKDKSFELYRLSLLRAKCCELISLHQNKQDDPINAFLCGLFSPLEAILDCPMPLLLSEIALPNEVKQALLENTGTYARYLMLATEYEKQHWQEVNTLISELKITEQQMIHIVLDATLWADEMLQIGQMNEKKGE